MGDQIVISGYRSLTQSLAATFFELVIVENCCWNFDAIYATVNSAVVIGCCFKIRLS